MSAPPTPQSGEELKDNLADIFANAADRIAPKQPHGSIERKIALGMMAETLMPLIKLFEELQAAAVNKLLDRVDTEVIGSLRTELTIRRGLTHDQAWQRCEAINEHIEEQHQHLAALRGDVGGEKAS